MDRASDYGSEGWGFESLRARFQIKAVTSANAGRGLDSFPEYAAIFHHVGAWCSDGAPLSMCCPGRGPYSPVLTSADVCRLVWIMGKVAVDRVSIIIHYGHPCGSRCGRPGAAGGPRRSAGTGGPGGCATGRPVRRQASDYASPCPDGGGRHHPASAAPDSCCGPSPSGRAPPAQEVLFCR